MCIFELSFMSCLKSNGPSFPRWALFNFGFLTFGKIFNLNFKL